jgi:hypothetical protein
MKRQQLLDLGINPRTLDQWEIDVVQAVVDEEFQKPLGLGDGQDYRTRVVNRLVGMGCQWHSEHNTFGIITRKYLQLVCPYCSGQMKTSTNSGNSSDLTAYLKCECGASAQVTMPPGGMSFTPPTRR